MKRIRLRLPSILYLIMLGSTPTCFAQQATLTDDAYFPQPKNSYNVKILSIEGSTSTRAFIRFEIVSNLPAATPGSHVSKATLKLFVNDTLSTGSFNIHRITSSWAESDTIAPTFDAIPIASATLPSASSFLTIDVTTIVQQWLGNDGLGAGGVANFGLVIIPIAGTAAKFDSKETTLSGHAPQLDILLNHAVTADTANTLNGSIDGSQVTGLISSATISGTNVTSAVADATRATTADTVIDGVYTTGSYSNPPWIASIDGGKITGTVARAALADTVLDGSITSPKISANQVVKSLNSLKDDVSLVAGANVSITPSGNTLLVSASAGLNAVSHDGTLVGSGTQGSPLSVKTPVVATPSNLFVGEGAGSRNTFGGSLSFFGDSAGRQNTTGVENSFFGSNAGEVNTTGTHNSFFGSEAGRSNTVGVGNNFYGAAAGFSNQSGHRNAFFGGDAGRNNVAGESNSFFGTAAGFNNQGSNNAFFGIRAGFNNTQGSNNAFFGSDSGSGNEDGSQNTFIGFQSRGTSSLRNATAIGASAFVSQSDSVVLGNNANVGVGVSAPKAKLHVVGGGLLIGSPGQGIILTAPNGTTCRLLTIDNSGAIVLTPVSCS